MPSLWEWDKAAVTQDEYSVAVPIAATDRIVETSSGSTFSLLVPEGYSQLREIPVRIQEDEDGTYIVTCDYGTMYGHGTSERDAFEDFSISLRDYFLRLVEDESILGVPLKEELELLSRVFVGGG